MKVIAKCLNYSGCVLADRGEPLELEPGQPLICPTCGSALVTTESQNSWVKTTLILSAIVLGIGALAAVFGMRAMSKSKPPAISETAPLSPEPSTPAPAKIDAPAPPAPSATAEPAKVLFAPAKIELDPEKGENKSVKSEVLSRIDLMPKVSSTNRDRLYFSVERARSMGKVLTIPFSSGQSSISAPDTQALKVALDKPEVKKLRDDPTAVFVVLGYADSKGDDKKNLEVSQLRADNVLGAMKSKCGIQNVMHSVAMGSSKLLAADNLEKNRIVEVWAVLP